jgi:hypothetical protein
MKFFNRVVFLLVLVSVFSVPVQAQDDLEKLLEEGVEDGRKLITAYTDPFMKTLSLSLNQGWYNTAKPHKIAGVDLTITVNAMYVPKDQMVFQPAALGLTNVELAPSSPGFPNAPTILGPDDSPVFRLKSNTSSTFEGPPGLDLEGNKLGNKVPVPMAHFGFGLPKGTDVKLRFTPTIELGDEGTVKLFGIGVMHDIKQWIPGIKLLPFDLSGFVGYTKFELRSKLDADTPSNADQEGVFTMNATTIQGVISKKFSVITFYGGLGYNIAKSNLALKGKYDLNEDGDKTDQFETNPIALKFAASGPRLTVGTRLKLAVFTFHADYTLQKYKCLTVGFGISVR